MIVPVDVATRAATAALLAAGVDAAGTALQVDLLVDADLAGRASHGLMRLPRIIERIRNGVADPATRGRQHWRGGLLDVDGCNGLGPVVACAALDALAVRAAEQGIAAAAIRRSNHLGMLGWYAGRVARAGQILIALCTSEALVHPWGGRTALLGTNPLAIGVPTAGEPFVLDMATSLISMGQIHDHALRGVPIPSHWALDAEGQPTTDAAAAKLGSIAPFGEAKGFALGLALEVLIVALTGSAIGTDVVGTLDSDRACNKGDVFIVIDPGRNPDTARRITDYLEAVRRSGLDGGRVAVPGDRAAISRRAKQVQGLALADEAWRCIEQLAAAPAAALENTRT